MKKGIYFILLAIVSLVCYTLFYNAKTHVEAVETTNELVTKADSLTTTVKILHKERDSAFTKIDLLDSTLVSKDSILVKQVTDLTTLKRNIVAIKKIGPIIVHDTVYITESKNFWGKKKTTIENVTSTDTLEIEETVTDTIQ
jgi:hypothetical protein